ncbi:MAG: hypothetical protein Q9214_005744 [Letrouitia sp. 1 TL-2023]
MDRNTEKMRSIKASSLINNEPRSEKAGTTKLSMGRAVVLISALNATVTVGAINTGAVADVVGNRTINLVGTFALSIFILAAGLATSGLQLTIFRALQGISSSMCFPTSVSILSAAFPGGRIRNIAFGCLGFGTPLGFAMGILLGGWFESTSIRWRPGLYCTAAIGMTLFAVNCWCLPFERQQRGVVWSRLKRDIDWIGVLISSVSMGLLSYSLAYQRVQHLSPIETAVRYMPNIVAGSTLNILTGLIVHRIAVNRYVVIISALCSVSPLLMAVIHVDWSWWLAGFWVNLLLPISVDGKFPHRVSSLLALSFDRFPTVNYTVANLLITNIFPKETQALAGAVYQMMSQLGISIGIAVLAVISNTVIDRSLVLDRESPKALMQGFRAVFWTCFAMMVSSTLVGMWGLRGWKEIGTTENSKQARPRGERLDFVQSKEGVEHLVVEGKAEQFESAVGAPPSPDLTSMFHFEPPPGLKLPTIEASSFEEEFSSLCFGAKITLDCKLDAIEGIVR